MSFFYVVVFFFETIAPSRNTSTRCATFAVSGSCVTMIIVVFFSLCSFLRKSMTVLLVLLSRFPVGSSARMTSGSTASARAIATLCCCPPESSLGLWSALSSSSTILRSSFAFRSRASGLVPWKMSGSVMFSFAESVLMRLNFWNMNPIFFPLILASVDSLNFAMSFPSR